MRAEEDDIEVLDGRPLKRLKTEGAGQSSQQVPREGVGQSSQHKHVRLSAFIDSSRPNEAYYHILVRGQSMNIELNELDMTYGASPQSSSSEVQLHLSGGGVPRLVCFTAKQTPFDLLVCLLADTKVRAHGKRYGTKRQTGGFGRSSGVARIGASPADPCLIAQER
jgi:hypothetical protein